MKTLKILLIVSLGLALIGMATNDASGAQTKTLTTILMVTVKVPQTQTVEASKGVEELHNVTLAQGQDKRAIKIEDPLNTPNGLPGYTMIERL